MDASLLPGPIHLLLALFLFLALGAAGSTALSLALESHGHRSKKIFAVRLSQQVDRLGMVLLVLALIGGGAAHALTLPGSPALEGLQRFLTRELLLATGIPFGLLLLLWVVRSLTWTRLKKRRPVHIAIGALTVLCLIATIVALAGVKRHLLSTGLAPAGPVPLADLYSWPADALVWPAMVHFLVLGIGAAAALTPLYLFVRRTREDFGRDYYAWSMGTIAMCAMLFLLGQLALLPWYYFGAGLTLDQDLLPVAGAGLSALFLAAIAFFLLGRSKTPMRYKGVTLLSILLVWVSLVALVMTAARIVGTP
jgi:hypothetical protein